MAIVLYERTPCFYSSPLGAESVCAWEPYAVLALHQEPASELIALCQAARVPATADAAHAALQCRHARIRAAYRELAAVYHPDAARASSVPPRGHRLFTWLSPYDQFTSIAAAYKLLSDVASTLEYHAACLRPSFTSQLDGASVRPRLADLIHAQRIHACVLQPHAALLRELRVHRAGEERAALQNHIAEVRRVQQHRAAHGGDGLIIQLALYGDAGVLTALLPQLRAGNVTAPPQRVIDVTDVVQGMVEITERDSVSESSVVQLLLPACSKATLEGFFDPAEGAPKLLFLRYTFLHITHAAVVDDEAGLKCPLKKHAIMEAAAPVTAPSTAHKAVKHVGSHAHTALRGGDRSHVLGDATNAGLRSSTIVRVRMHAVTSPSGKARGSADVMNETENMTFHTPLSASFTSARSHGPDDSHMISGDDCAPLLDASLCRSRASTVTDDAGVVTFVKEVDAATGQVHIVRGTAAPAAAVAARATAITVRPQRVARKLFSGLEVAPGHAAAVAAASTENAGVDVSRELLKSLRERAHAKQQALDADAADAGVLIQVGGVNIRIWHAVAALGAVAALAAAVSTWRRSHAAVRSSSSR